MPNEETKTAPELPPLTITKADYHGGHKGVAFMAWPEFHCRERQLSAAQRENQELRAQLAAEDERIAELEAKHGECLPHHVQIELCERLRAAASRVAELEATLKSIREQVVEKPTRFRSQGASWDYYECSEVDPILERYAQQVAALQLKTRKAGD